MSEPTVFLGLDWGGRRIGVARGSSAARLASPLATIAVDGQEFERLAELARQESAQGLVLGLPRGLSGRDTEQTGRIRVVSAILERRLGLPVTLQDEAGTTKQAEQEAGADAKDLDAKAAAIILQDYLNSL